MTCAQRSVFDPFNPLKILSRPASPESDKENATPPAMTAYFERQRVERDAGTTSPPKLGGRLASTLDAIFENVSVVGRKAAGMEVCFNEDEEHPPDGPSSLIPRTPLADISFELSPSPTSRKMVYQREELHPSVPPLPIVKITPASQDAPLHTFNHHKGMNSPESSITPPVSSPIEPSSTAHLAPSSTPSLLLSIQPPGSGPSPDELTLSTEPRVPILPAEQSASFSCMDTGSFDLLHAHMDIGSGSGIGMDSELFLSFSGIDAMFDRPQSKIGHDKQKEPPTTTASTMSTPCNSIETPSKYASMETVKATKKHRRFSIKPPASDAPAVDCTKPSTSSHCVSIPSSRPKTAIAQLPKPRTSIAPLPKSRASIAPLPKPRASIALGTNSRSGVAQKPRPSSMHFTSNSRFPTVPALRIIKRGHTHQMSTSPVDCSSGLGPSLGDSAELGSSTSSSVTILGGPIKETVPNIGLRPVSKPPLSKMVIPKRQFVSGSTSTSTASNSKSTSTNIRKPCSMPPPSSNAITNRLGRDVNRKNTETGTGVTKPAAAVPSGLRQPMRYGPGSAGVSMSRLPAPQLGRVNSRTGRSASVLKR